MQIPTNVQIRAIEANDTIGLNRSVPKNDPYFPALNTTSGRPHCIAFTRSLPGQQRQEQINNRTGTDRNMRCWLPKNGFCLILLCLSSQSLLAERCYCLSTRYLSRFFDS